MLSSVQMQHRTNTSRKKTGQPKRRIKFICFVILPLGFVYCGRNDHKIMNFRNFGGGLFVYFEALSSECARQSFISKHMCTHINTQNEAIYRQNAILFYGGEKAKCEKEVLRCIPRG